MTHQRALPGLEAPVDAANDARAELVDLDERRRLDLAAIRASLGDKPDDFTWPEWRVALRLLAPDPHMVPGTAGARKADLEAALECFPALRGNSPAALRAYRQARESRKVREFIAEFRALEALPLLDLRARVREVLLSVAETAIPFGPDAGEAHGGWAKAALAKVAAAKALIELDGLQAGGAAELAAARSSGEERDDLAERVGRAVAAYRGRKAAAEGPAGQGDGGA